VRSHRERAGPVAVASESREKETEIREGAQRRGKKRRKRRIEKTKKKKRKTKKRRKRRRRKVAPRMKKTRFVFTARAARTCASRVWGSRLSLSLSRARAPAAGPGPRLLGPALLRSPSGPVPAEGPVWDAMPRLVLTVASDEGAPFCSLPLRPPPLHPLRRSLCPRPSPHPPRAALFGTSPSPSYFPACARRHDSRARVCVTRQARV